jgi:signal peptidase II
LSIAVLVIAADVISKVLVVANIPEYSYVHVIGNVFMLTQVRNGGAAFNLGGTSITIVFTLIAAAVIAFILRFAGRMRSLGWAIALGLLLGGATGNLIDRIFRAPAPFRGDVVDWIYVTRYWPVFNVADSCIVCGGILTVLLALRGIRIDGTRLAAARSTTPEHTTSESTTPESTTPEHAASNPDYPKSDYPE